MKFRYFLLMPVLIVVGAAFSYGQSCFEADIGGPATPWTNLNFNNNASNFQFVIASDRTGKMRAGVFADAVRKINLLEPEFVICVGDLIEGYTEDANELEIQWSEFEEIVSRLETPFFHVAGNHDVSNALMLEAWRERFGPSYYHFVYKDVLFLCLNTESGGRNHKEGRISDEQLDYFREVLDKHRQARWTLVFLHKPVWEYEDPSWLRFEQLLADRPYTVFRASVCHSRPQRQALYKAGYYRRGQPASRPHCWNVRPHSVGDYDR